MIFNSSGPRDDLSEAIFRFLQDCLSRNNNNSDNLEIEAKFGLLLDKGTNARVELPVLSECIVNHEGWTNFVSDMPLHLHRQFNEGLNRQFSNRALGWKYLHTKTVDRIMPDKTRLTFDASNGSLLSAQRKQNINHLAIFQPNCVMDVRLSVNMEHKIPIESIKDEVLMASENAVKRKKDRVSYEVARGLLSVDLTQVAQNDGSGNKIKHELELEVKNPELLFKSPEALKDFVDSIREMCQLIK